MTAGFLHASVPSQSWTLSAPCKALAGAPESQSHADGDDHERTGQLDDDGIRGRPVPKLDDATTTEAMSLTAVPAHRPKLWGLSAMR